MIENHTGNALVIKVAKMIQHHAPDHTDDECIAIAVEIVQEVQAAIVSRMLRDVGC